MFLNGSCADRDADGAAGLLRIEVAPGSPRTKETAVVTMAPSRKVDETRSRHDRHPRGGWESWGAVDRTADLGDGSHQPGRP
jgi:hypothetical protein